MGLPVRPGWKLVLPLKVLKESDHAPDLGDNGGLKAAFIVLFDESPQSLVDPVSDLHGDFYLDYRSASSYAIRCADGDCTPGKCPAASQCGDGVCIRFEFVTKM